MSESWIPARLAQLLGPRGPAWTSVVAAAREGDADRIRALCQAGAPLVSNGVSALFGAVWEGHADCVRVLCEGGADVDFVVDGETSLCIAAHHGHVGCVRALCELGANIRHLNRRDLTPLRIAALTGHADCVRALYEAGADINPDTSHASTSDSTYRTKGPLHIVAHYGHTDCVRVLCEVGAVVNCVDELGTTPLRMAAQAGHVDCVRALCESGADINQPCLRGGTPLHYAAQEGRTDCVRALCELGADVHRAAEDGSTPLHLAAIRGHTTCVQLISSYGGRGHQQVDHRTEADCVERQGHTDLAAWLRAINDWTPLHHLEWLTPERARVLLREGADLLVGTPSALERARQVDGDASALVRLAGGGWSPASHSLFPARARAHALAVARLGYALAWQRFPTEARSLIDPWTSIVLHHAIQRDDAA